VNASSSVPPFFCLCVRKKHTVETEWGMSILDAVLGSPNDEEQLPKRTWADEGTQSL